MVSWWRGDEIIEICLAILEMQQENQTYVIVEAAVRRCPVKKGFLKI